MTDLSQMIRWNAGFVRGLAQSVLERAKTIRSSLAGAQEETSGAAPAPVAKSAKPIKTVKRAAPKKRKSPTRAPAARPRRNRRDA